MWFKNLQLYRLPAPWDMTAARLDEMLSAHAFVPGSGLELQTQGWVPPRPDGTLVHSVNGQYLITLRTEKKLLPAAVVNQVTKARAAEIEEQQGYKPGRKQLREIKEEVTDTLLPRAFAVQRDTRAWIDPVNGLLVVDAATPSKADELLGLLNKSVDRLPLANLHVRSSPALAMTAWLQCGEVPGAFTVDQDTELRATDESKAAVRYVRHSAEADDVRRHVDAGKQCTRLALTWADKISFVLTDQLVLKRLEPLDVLKENAGAGGQNEEERFNGDFALMTGELGRLIANLVDALDGEPKARA